MGSTSVFANIGPDLASKITTLDKSTNANGNINSWYLTDGVKQDC